MGKKLSSVGSTSAMWDPQVAALAERFRLVRYDHPGHGGSAAQPGDYALADLAGALLPRREAEVVGGAEQRGPPPHQYTPSVADHTTPSDLERELGIDQKRIRHYLRQRYGNLPAYTDNWHLNARAAEDVRTHFRAEADALRASGEAVPAPRTPAAVTR